MTTIGARLGYTAVTDLVAAVRAVDPHRQVRRDILDRHAQHDLAGRLRWCNQPGHPAKARYRSQADALAAETELACLPGHRPGEPYLHGHHWHLRTADTAPDPT